MNTNCVYRKSIECPSDRLGRLREAFFVGRFDSGAAHCATVFDVRNSEQHGQATIEKNT
jgi:hypothetical protein